MLRVILALTLFALVACDQQSKEGNREVVSLSSPAGQAFHFMPIYEKGVTDITVRVAWPTEWPMTEGRNQSVPYIGSELILSGGTAELKPQDVLEIFDSSNAQGFLVSSADHVFGELSFPKDHIERTVEIANEMLVTPQLNEQWMERTKQGFLENVGASQALSTTKMWNAARLASVGDTPLNDYLSLNDLDAIKAITRDDVAAWHAETFTKSGLTVVVTGAVSPEDAGQIIDDLLSGLPQGEARPPAPRIANIKPQTVLLHLPDAEKSAIGFLSKMPPRSEGGEFEDILASALMSDANGPLFQAIRTDLRASYGFQAGVTNYARGLRPFFMFGEVDTDKLGEVRDATLDAYAAFKEKPDLTGLGEMKERFVSSANESIAFVDVSARAIMEAILDGNDPTVVPKIDTYYEAVTPETLTARLDSAFPNADSFAIFAISPDAEALPGACVIEAFEDVANCP